MTLYKGVLTCLDVEISKHVAKIVLALHAIVTQRKIQGQGHCKVTHACEYSVKQKSLMTDACTQDFKFLS